MFKQPRYNIIIIMIYVIGLGNEGEGLSPDKLEKIRSCGAVVVKTALARSYKSVVAAQVEYITLDEIYQKSRNFDTLNSNLADAVRKIASRHNDVAYLVDGSGYEDASVAILRKKVKGVEIIPAASKAYILRFFPSTSYAVFSAQDFIVMDYPEFSRRLPLVIYEIDGALLAADVKLKLFEYFPEDTPILFYDGESAKEIFLFELDRQKNYSYSSSALIFTQDFLSRERFSFSDLLLIMDRLRGEGGCPWDRAQNHQSIKMNAVEEAYELVEAIDSGDSEAMMEEAGDLLLQTVFHSHISKQEGQFDIDDVISQLCRKLIFRHSHVFGSQKAAEAEQALATWEKNKSVEKGQDTYTKALKGVARSFPAIMRAAKVQKRAAKCGFEFQNIDDIFGKLAEEVEELKGAISSGDPSQIEKEVGDLLFSAVNIARWLGVDGELALNASTNKFIKRFEYMENRILESGKTLFEVSLEDMEKHYQEGKDER